MIDFYCTPEGYLANTFFLSIDWLNSFWFCIITFQSNTDQKYWFCNPSHRITNETFSETLLLFHKIHNENLNLLEVKLNTFAKWIEALNYIKVNFKDFLQCACRTYIVDCTAILFWTHDGTGSSIWKMT